MKPESIEILDTTLRDGAQSEGISFSVNDKFKIAELLSSIGIKYIEAGNPGSNPKDREFFSDFNKKCSLKECSRLTAFGSTRRKGVSQAVVEGICNLVAADTETVVIFGKTWDREVLEILRCSPKENQEMIRDSVEYLVSLGKEVIFDAEHYFEAYISNPDYALDCLMAAQAGGAYAVVLCDTNGASMPELIESCVREAIERLDCKIGIHCHNDSGMAVANSISAILAGATHLQGTFNGIGERCGNANLSTLIPNLQLKYKISCIPEESMENLTRVARAMAEISNITLTGQEPYIGTSAFSHKAGMHVDGVKKNASTFEHVSPEMVGNSRRFLMSEISGRSSLIEVIKKYQPDIDKNSADVTRILANLKELEHKGYHFEGAEASQELLICKELQLYEPFFSLEKMRISGDLPWTGEFSATAFIKICVGKLSEVTASEGDGPVNAMDKALRKALEVFYPEIKNIHLTDYKVRVISTQATASQVRVLIESTDGKDIWSTIGVSTDILEASWIALVDSLEYKLMKAKMCI
ncbi:MAG: citramalate synthase [Saccharofermentanales bacterium]